MIKKIIIVCQQDEKDCGPCALQSIIRYYNGYVSLEKIREDAFTDTLGTTVYHLINAAKKYGFDAIAKKYLDKNIKDLILPAIVHIKYSNGLTHFMTLYEIKNNKLLLMDPSKGKIILSTKEFNNIFTGVVIELFPKNKILTLEKSSNIYSFFFNILKTNKSLCIKILFTSILLTIFSIITSFNFKIYYNLYDKQLSNNLKIYIIYLSFVVLLAKIFLDYLRKYYENHLSKNIDVGVFKSFISHIFKLPLKIVSSRSTGEIISRVNELGSIKSLFSEIFVTCFLDLLLSIVAIILLFNINYKLSLILSLSEIVYILICIISSPYIYKRIKENIDYQTIANTVLIENIDMINSSKNLNKINKVINKNEEKEANLIFDNFDFTSNYNVIEVLKNIISDVTLFAINFYGFYLISISKLSIVDLVTFNSLVIYFLDPIKNVVSLIPKFNFLRASFNKICDFIDIEEEENQEEELFENGNIEFRKVNYSYNDYTKILNNFNLKIRQSEKVMIKGKSGCGKSTICQLLEKNIIASSGNITINNKNILDYSLNTIRNNITYVGQKEKLYSDTIKNNIIFYNDNNLDFDKVCNICFIEDIVNKKMFRYNFGIDNSSDNISGGEKQRIVLARALLKKSKILILDEALSEVDYVMEKNIILNIKKNYPEKTIIYITHKKQDNLFERVINITKCEND